MTRKTPEIPDFLTPRQMEVELGISRASVQRTRQHMHSLILPKNTFRVPATYTAAVREALDESRISKAVTVARQFSLTEKALELIEEEEAGLDHGINLYSENRQIGRTAIMRLLNVTEHAVDSWRNEGIVSFSRPANDVLIPTTDLMKAISWQLPEELRGS